MGGYVCDMSSPPPWRGPFAWGHVGLGSPLNATASLYAPRGAGRGEGRVSSSRVTPGVTSLCGDPSGGGSTLFTHPCVCACMQRGEGLQH